MDMKPQIQKDIQAAMKSGENVKRETLRGLLATLTNMEMESTDELTQDDFITVVNREVKKRREAIEAYKDGGREDRAEKETQEMEILQAYLPEQLSEDDIKAAVQSIIDDISKQGAPNMGQVMGQAMGKLKGQVDGNVVRQVVSQLLES
jgi:hypothetical protein